jgi:hypothetical protein
MQESDGDLEEGGRVNMERNLSRTLAQIRDILKDVRFVGTDQNPGGVRDLITYAAVQANAYERDESPLTLSCNNATEKVRLGSIQKDIRKSRNSGYVIITDPEGRNGLEVSSNLRLFKWEMWLERALDKLTSRNKARGSEAEEEVIQAAKEIMTIREGSKYGQFPQQTVNKAWRRFDSAMSELASERDGDI